MPRIDRILTVSLALALSPCILRAQPLQSPWDIAPVKLTATPYACPTLPPIPVDLTTDGFYRLDDPTHSIIDPVREEAYRQSSEPVKHAGSVIVAAADAFRTTGSRAAAQCVIDLTAALAQANSFAGKMSSNQAYYVQGWIGGAIAIAFLKVRDSGLATPQQTAAISAWLLRIDRTTRGYYDSRRTGDDGQNNHFYWAGIQSAAIGVVANDRGAFDWGIHAYRVGVHSIRPDGTLPLEMKRGTRALHYHLYALAPLVLLAEFGAANRLDLYAAENGAIHRLVHRSVDGLLDPGPFQRATGIKQEVPNPPSGDAIGWAPPYQRRFPLPQLARLIANAPTLNVFYLGGLPPDVGGPPAPLQKPAAAAGEVNRQDAGDSPEDAGPLATDLAHGLKKAAIDAAMRKVADWQIRTGAARFNQQWTFAPLYDGLIAASAASGDDRYRAAVETAAKSFGWKLIDVRFPHADDEALGLAYLQLYQQHPSPEKIAATRETMDRLVTRPDDPAKLLWWWCDSLFMAPPVLARLSQITGDPKYRTFMDREWTLTKAALYDEKEKLYSRDDRFLTRTEKNGRKLFWSRGNGWVLAGLAQVLEVLPADDPMRPEYVAQFQAMADRMLELQPEDGLWRTGLLDQASYDAPEVSGTGFFTYAMAWGVNAGLLDRAHFEPALRKAWDGMLGHIYEDGRLGSIQPIDAAPGAVKPTSSYVYGVGAFLLAGAQLDRMIEQPAPAKR